MCNCKNCAYWRKWNSLEQKLHGDSVGEGDADKTGFCVINPPFSHVNGMNFPRTRGDEACGKSINKWLYV